MNSPTPLHISYCHNRSSVRRRLVSLAGLSEKEKSTHSSARNTITIAISPFVGVTRCVVLPPSISARGFLLVLLISGCRSRQSVCVCSRLWVGFRFRSPPLSSRRRPRAVAIGGTRVGLLPRRVPSILLLLQRAWCGGQDVSYSLPRADVCVRCMVVRARE